MSRSCRPRWRNPAASRPVARCSSSSSSSTSSSPARAASAVMRVSTPNPAATGKQSARATGERNRCPESGSRASKPDAQRARARAQRPSRSRSLRPACGRRRRQRGRRRFRPEDAGRRGGRRRRAAAPRAARRARRASAPVPCRGAAAAARWRPPPRRSLRSRRVEPSSATTTPASGKSRPQLVHGPADALRLVARGNEDGEVSHRQRGSGSGSIGGRMPSSAVSRTP